MTYLQFRDGDGTVLVEIAPQEVQERPGVVKAGIGEKLSDSLLKAQSTLESAVAAVIDRSAGAFVRAIKALEEPPDVVEIQFSVKATGELGNFAVGKLSGDSNFAVKLTWSKTSP
jgi:Trypsin-co-occurring domain 1